MAHFFLPQTQQRTDFFALGSCGTVKAGLWNDGGPPLTISSDNTAVASLWNENQYGGDLQVGRGVFEFFITAVGAGNMLITAKRDTGALWAASKVVVTGSDLCLNATGENVTHLKERLNLANPTRLPRLVGERFDVMTKARVMEFQFRHGLKVDGAAGKKTLSVLAKTPASPIGAAPKGQCILVDLIHLTLFAYKNGALDMKVTPVRGGAANHPSHAGVFPMSTRRLREHTSSTYPVPPGNMNFSLFYNGPEALHQGPAEFESKGCIHVNPPYAEQLFNWAGSSDVLVIVIKP